MLNDVLVLASPLSFGGFRGRLCVLLAHYFGHAVRIGFCPINAAALSILNIIEIVGNIFYPYAFAALAIAGSALRYVSMFAWFSGGIPAHPLFNCLLAAFTGHESIPRIREFQSYFTTFSCKQHKEQRFLPGLKAEVSALNIR